MTFRREQRARRRWLCDVYGVRTLGLVLLAVVGMLTLATGWMPARELFGFGVLHADDVGLTLAAGATVLVCLEFGKRFTINRLAA